MGGVEAGDLAGLRLGLGGSGGGFGAGSDRDLFGPVGAASAEVERIPTEAEAAQNDGDQRQHRDAHGQPAQRRHGPEDPRRHGNTFRSSSKWGPSRRRGQSPPQTKATPFAFAAALMLSAMRG